MTVASEINRSGQYTGNGSAKVFGYGFRIVNQSHLRLVKADLDGVEMTLTLTTHYTVSGVGASVGGSVTLVSPLPTGHTLTILRDVPFTQETDLENQGAYYAQTVEDALDLAVMRDQQLAEELKRAVKVPISADDPDGELSDDLAQGILDLAPIVSDIEKVSAGMSKVSIVSNSISEVETVAENMDAVIAANGSVLSHKAQSYVATTGQMIFTMPGAAFSPQNVIVWVDGARQVPVADYSVSNDKLLFVTAPGAGAAVDVLLVSAVSFEDVEALAAEAQAANFPTRDAAVAAIPSLVGMANGKVITAAGLRYIRASGAAAIADMPGWLPYGDVTPNHFADNTTPGVTDMTAAIQAAADYTSRVVGLAEDYRISGTVFFREFGITGFQNCGFHGAGPLRTRIIQADQTKDAFAVIRSNQSAAFLTVPSFKDFSIHFSLTAGNTSDCAGIRTRQAINGEYVNVHIFGPQWGFANERVGQGRFEGCFYQGGWSMKTKGMFLWTNDPSSNSGNCYGNFVSNCESSGSHFGTNTIHQLQAVDGLYISNCHWNHCTRCYVIGADGVGGRDKVVSVYVTNVYHDYSPSVPKVSDVWFSGMTGAAGSFGAWGISFGGGVFRTESPTGIVLGFDFVTGALDGIGTVHMVKFDGVDIRGYRNGSIFLSLPSGLDSKAILQNWIVTDNCFQMPYTPTREGLTVSGSGVSIEGNVFIGNWENATFPPVFISSRSDNVNIGDANVFLSARTNPVSIATAATNIFYLRNASYANDAAAAAAGVPVMGRYRGTDGNIKWRVS